jgi:hypothetical protein
MGFGACTYAFILAVYSESRITSLYCINIFNFVKLSIEVAAISCPKAIIWSCSVFLPRYAIIFADDNRWMESYR